MKIVVDTNVWVSALVFGGKSYQIFKLIAPSSWSIVMSIQINLEIKRVLAQKFPDHLIDYEELLEELRPNLQFIRAENQKINIVRDPKDNMILETAIAGGADYIISGDDDLLSLKKYQNILIKTPAEFLETSVK